MVAIRVDASEVEALADRLIASNPVVARHLTVAMTRATAQVERDAKVLVPVDTGHLRRSITTDVTPFVGRIGTNVPYARDVEGIDENGKLTVWSRRPGEPLIPEGVLLKWMSRHGFPPEAETNIRVKIQKKGIRARPYLTPALERNRNAINREFARELDAAVRELAA